MPVWSPSGVVLDSPTHLVDASGRERKCPEVPAHPDVASVIDNIRAAERSRWLIMAAPRLLWFYGQVRNRGPWDYKQIGQMLDDLGRWVPSPYRDFGNFNFGATGAAAGVPLDVLLRAAGWAQGRAGTSDPAWGNWYGRPPYGDDPYDQELIRAGYDCYKSGCYR